MLVLTRRLESPVSLALVVLLAAGWSLSGCSWIFVQPLPVDDPGDYAHCTTTRIAPVFDTIFTVTNLASAVYVAGEDNAKNKGVAVTAGVAAGGLWLASAIYGYTKTSACIAAKEEGDSLPFYQRQHPYGYVPPPVDYPAPQPAPDRPQPPPGKPGPKLDAPKSGG